jgi:hypothetical protein
MSGIIPDSTNGGVIVRSLGGVCVTPVDVTNAYCPDADFTSTCALRYLSDGCTARITSAQINAFQSEMLCLAETMNPNGNWNCGDLCNLSSSFTQWAASAGNFDGSMLDYLERHICGLPAITDPNAFPTSAFILCDGAGRVVRFAENRMSKYIVDEICASLALASTLAPCLISVDAGNLIVPGSDGKLYATFQTPVQTVAGICSDVVAKANLQNCLKPYPIVISGVGTTVVVGTDMSGAATYRVNALGNAITSVALDFITFMGASLLESKVVQGGVTFADSVPLSVNPTCVPLVAPTALATDMSVQRAIHAHVTNVYVQNTFIGLDITPTQLNAGTVLSTGAGASSSYTNPLNCSILVELVASRDHAAIDIFGFGGVFHNVFATVTTNLGNNFVFGSNNLHQNICNFDNPPNDTTTGHRSDTGAAIAYRAITLAPGETVTMVVSGTAERVGNALIIGGDSRWVLSVASAVSANSLAIPIYSSTIRGVLAGVI